MRIHRSLPILSALLGSALCGAPERPNILWITTEDLSPRLGCYGDSVAETPVIDRLAAEGLRFTHAFSTYGVCAPSRFSLITGMYPQTSAAGAMRTGTRTGAIEEVKDPELLAIPLYEAVPPAPVRCFPEQLRAAGYYCTNNAKKDYQFNDPATTWDESSTEAHWRNRPDPDMPFFAVFNFQGTHESRIHSGANPEVTRRRDMDRILPPYVQDTPAAREDFARQYDGVAALDAFVKGLLEELEADGLAGNTYVFFYSDHGDGLPRGKRWVYDSGTRVPLIIRFPDGSRAGEVTDRLVDFTDFGPTVLSLAGIPKISGINGQAFLGAFEEAPRRYVYAARDRMDPHRECIRSVRGPRFRYVRNYLPNQPYLGFIPYRDRAAAWSGILQQQAQGSLTADQWQFADLPKPMEELYDLQNDPWELHNLAADPVHREKLGEMRAALERFDREYGRDLNRDFNGFNRTESELVRTILWPPDGRQPTTTQPEISYRAVPGKRDEVLLSVISPDPGASIGYRFSNDGPWQVYTGPFPYTLGQSVQILAHRIGYKPVMQRVRLPAIQTR